MKGSVASPNSATLGIAGGALYPVSGVSLHDVSAQRNGKLIVLTFSFDCTTQIANGGTVFTSNLPVPTNGSVIVQSASLHSVIGLLQATNSNGYLAFTAAGPLDVGRWYLGHFTYLTV